MASSSSTSHSENRVSLRVFALLAAAFVAVEGAFALLLPEGLMTRTARGRVAEITALAPPDIQIMGDSVANGGLSTGLLRDRLAPTALRVSNFSVPGISPLFMPFILERQLARQSDGPRYILYAPNSAALGSVMADRFIGRFAAAQEIPESGLLGVSPSDLAYGVCCRLSYTLRYREELRAAVTGGDAGFFRTLGAPYSDIASLDSAPWVTVPEAESAADSAEVRFPVEAIGPELRRPFSVASANRRALDRFAELAAERGITIFWVCLPTVRSVAELRGGREFDRLYVEFLTEFAGKHSNVRVLHGKPDVLPDSLFLDPWHLNTEGASLFTARIAVELLRELASDLDSSTVGTTVPAP